jgi:hypothetical protein
MEINPITEQRRQDYLDALYARSGRTCNTYTGLYQQRITELVERDMDELLGTNKGWNTVGPLRELRAARRPKPLSLKEQALKDVDEMLKNPGSPVYSDFDRIISALKSIPDPS